jgi:hypothetical protein
VQLISLFLQTALSEDLNSVVAEIHDDQEAIRRHANARWSIQLPRTGTGSAKLAQEVPIWLEYLYSVIPGVGDNNVSFLVNGDTLWAKKLTIARAFSSKETSRLEIRVDDQQTVIVEICNDHVSIIVETNTPGRVKVLP